MKKIIVLIGVLLTIFMVSACEYNQYAGTYRKTKAGDYVVTVTLRGNGSFTAERVWTEDSIFAKDPLLLNKFNGNFTVEEDTITISFDYYDEVNGALTKVISGKIKDGKLTFSESLLGERIFTKI